MSKCEEYSGYAVDRFLPNTSKREIDGFLHYHKTYEFVEQ